MASCPAPVTWRSGGTLYDRSELVEIRPERSVRLLSFPPAVPDKPTVFFIHGSCASMSQFFPLIEGLCVANGFGCVAYDMFGCGRSPKPEDWGAYAFTELRKDARAVWDRHQRQLASCQGAGAGPTTVVGHSFGCHLAMGLALELQDERQPPSGDGPAAAGAPVAPAGLVLLAGSLQTMDGGHPIFRLPVFALNWLQPTLSASFKTMAFHPSADPELLADQEAKSGSNPMHMCKAYYRQVRGLTADEVARLQVRTLVVHGEADQVLPVAGAEALCAALPNTEGDGVVLVPSVSHNLMLEDPQALVEPLAGFVCR